MERLRAAPATPARHAPSATCSRVAWVCRGGAWSARTARWPHTAGKNRLAVCAERGSRFATAASRAVVFPEVQLWLYRLLTFGEGCARLFADKAARAIQPWGRRSTLFRHRLVTSSAVLSILGSAIAIAPATPAAASGGTRQIAAAGVTSIRGTSLGADVLAKNEIRGGAAESGGLAPAGPNAPTAGSVDRSASKKNGDQAASGERDNGARGGSALNLIRSFDGLNHRQQRLANGGNQFSLEPPDQGLCVGNGFVMEIINDVTRVYDASGNGLQAVTDLNTFFGYPAAFHRPGGPFCAFVTDPSFLFDKATQVWYADVLTIEVFPEDGNFTGQNHLDLAVSNGPSPLGLWTVYRTDVTDDGTNGTPNHGCVGIPPFGQPHVPTHPNACLGDYPHLGADANGIYLTTNEYSFFGNDFHGAQVYAYSKRALAQHAATVDVTQIDTHGMDNGNSGFTLWPAVATGQQQNAQGGTEYFLSSNA